MRAILDRMLQRSRNVRVIDRLHGEIVAAARRPVFYREFGVEDTFEGRFEVFTLHAVLSIRQLGRYPSPGRDMAQDLTDSIFRHFDVMLREIGVGDLSVPKRVKSMAEAFLGRAAAYDAALSA